MQGGFLGQLAHATRAQLEAVATRREWSEGTTLFREGDQADRVIIIETGLVKAVSTSPDGVETVLGLRGSGDVLGELAAIDGGTRSASVSVIRPVTGLAVEVTAFRRFLATHADACYELLAIVTRRVRDASRRQSEYGSLDTTSRLATVLVELAVEHGQPTADGIEVSLLTQDELAGLTGASRESTARGLRALREAGLITTQRRRIAVHDLRALAAWSTGDRSPALEEPA